MCRSLGNLIATSARKPMPDLMVLPASAIPPVPRRGHAGTPGKGPAGETCGSCNNFVKWHEHDPYARPRKCLLTRPKWTRSAGTDVRASDPACERWSGA
jgi:hypothetical protein